MPVTGSPRKTRYLAAHGKSVLTGLPARSAGSGDGVAGHAQIVEDTPDIACELVDGGGDAVAALGLDQTGGKAAQARDVFRAVAGTQGAAVLIPVPIEYVVVGFNTPVVAVECE